MNRRELLKGMAAAPIAAAHTHMVYIATAPHWQITEHAITAGTRIEALMEEQVALTSRALVKATKQMMEQYATNG